ncbi:GNAT family N-acetyltransferase [Rhizobium leguminosarum]|uniref:GNAT family N-acetyltransferase n=1 Tax=Rhizobium leguminosarum TaxID=384 RepID=UPI001C965521|nr:GNAT family N-acetyltransferase [Rhizobium leguminosarum]MBY5363684.1 GNAT family N-acetyltransferase [Rhizobium leguminosarum]
MKKDLQIRAANTDDASAISNVIAAALRESNAKDYSPTVIQRIERNFDPTAIVALINRRKVFVAVSARKVIGTASLDGDVIRTVFVSPAAQRQGVGTKLMAVIEELAREAGVGTLSVPSSVTAEQFYLGLGYQAVHDCFHGEERTIIMQRVLVPRDQQSSD